MPGDFSPEAADPRALKPRNALLHRPERDVRSSFEGPSDVEIVTSNGDYYINIGIGSPPQTFLASLNTGLGDLLVFSDLCDACLDFYDPTKSPTSVNTSTFLTILTSKDATSDNGQTTINAGKVDGYVFNDTVLLGERTVSTANFLALASGAFMPGPAFTGISPAAFGLGPAGSARTTGTRTPLWQAALAAQGAALKFGLWLARTATDDDAENLLAGGLLTLGGANASLFSGDIEFLNMDPLAAFWELNISDISVRGKSISINSATRRVVFDPTFKYIMGPAADVAALWAAVPGSANVTDTAPALHSFPCNTTLNFTISFGGRVWSINDTDMSFGPVAVGSPQCKGVLISDRFIDPPEDPTGTWIFGVPFLKNVYSVYRQTPPSIGLAELSSVAGGTASTISSASVTSATASPTQATTGGDNRPKNSSNAGAIVGGIISGVVLLLLLAVVFLYRRRRAHSKIGSSYEVYTPRHSAHVAAFTLSGENAPSNARLADVKSPDGGGMPSVQNADPHPPRADSSHELGSLPGIGLDPSRDTSSSRHRRGSLPPSGAHPPADTDPNILHALENLRDEMREVRWLALAERAETRPSTDPPPEYD
ncbi:hypothetical protein MVEN_01404700 [Mycena venus]|uniref:Peptidase A1 domain-containing protein n=1 Tax=Mycena venus TaxID=2733690 RepID=A0A8H6XYY9_9AGAR|nr:hypothetical protein MVEN_01404700 [Mycena venus]